MEVEYIKTLNLLKEEKSKIFELTKTTNNIEQKTEYSKKQIYEL